MKKIYAVKQLLSSETGYSNVRKINVFFLIKSKQIIFLKCHFFIKCLVFHLRSAVKFNRTSTFET